MKKEKLDIVSKADALARRANTLRFMKLILENVYTFYGVNEIPLDEVGLVKVTGRNLDTKDESSNGAGKSRAWTCLLRLFYGRKALGREAVGAAFNPDIENMRIEAEFHRGGHVFVARETKKHKDYPDGLHVTRDGKPWGPKNDPELLRRELQAVLNRTYEEFIGTVIWKQNVDHVLVTGTPSERSTWISNFFGLNVYDEMYSLFSKKYDNTKHKVLEMSEVRARAKVIRESIENVGDVKKAKVKAKKIRLVLETLVKKSDKNTTLVEELRDKESDLKLLADLRGQISEAGADGKTAEGIDKQIAETKDKSKKLEDQIRLAADADDITSEYKELSKTGEQAKIGLLRLYQEIFKGDGNIPTTVELKPYVIEAAERSAVLRANLERAKANFDVNKKAILAARKLEDLGYADCNLKYLKKMRNMHLSILSEQEKVVAKNESVVECEKLLDQHLVRCPTCRTKIDAKLLKDEIDKAQGAIIEAAKIRKTNKRELDTVEEAITLKEKADRKVDGEEMDFEVVTKKIAKLELKTVALKKMLELAETYEASNAKLKKLESDYARAKKLSGFDIDDAKVKLRKASKTLDKLIGVRSMLSRYEKITKQYKLEDSVEMELSGLKRKRVKLEDDNAEISEKLTAKRIKLDRLSGEIDAHAKLVSSYEKLGDDLKQLKKLERKERIYKALKEAYDKNGLKVRRLKELLAAIKTRLPVWTNILFTEKNMSIDTTGNEKKIGFEVTQKRKTVDKAGKSVVKVKRYDAGEASGSERTRISCALMLTMADVASDEKQCNLLVLDELERGLDKPSRRIMSEEIIPLLKHKKPSLFLITHSLDVDREHVDSYMTITKKNQQSTVKFVSNVKNNTSAKTSIKVTKNKKVKA